VAPSSADSENDGELTLITLVPAAFFDSLLADDGPACPNPALTRGANNVRKNVTLRDVQRSVLA